MMTDICDLGPLDITLALRAAASHHARKASEALANSRESTPLAARFWRLERQQHVKASAHYRRAERELSAALQIEITPVTL